MTKNQLINQLEILKNNAWKLADICDLRYGKRILIPGALSPEESLFHEFSTLVRSVMRSKL